ncbi:hypothetical protein ACLI09_05980 [Flavobacterium sp. RHBU_24]|uniref:hypothetical protein n=1 Tax=Flavobacterium sp. RHBU_24 TaxID=3391185 RepID=UPI003984B045
MKTITLLVAGLFLTGGLATASEINVFSGNISYNYYPVDYRNAEPVIFMERGIEFMVFPNGEMDFNTQPSVASGSYYRTAQPSRRANQNTTYGAPGYQNAGHGVRVDHDYNGRVRRVGNVYINYDYNGRVKRIGSVYMSYNRFALNQIGLLKLIYDNRGRIVDARGYVNVDNRGYAYQPAYNDTTGGNYNNGYQNNYNGDTDNSDDNDNYYYRPAAPATSNAPAQSGGSRQK